MPGETGPAEALNNTISFSHSGKTSPYRKCLSMACTTHHTLVPALPARKQSTRREEFGNGVTKYLQMSNWIGPDCTVNTSERTRWSEERID